MRAGDLYHTGIVVEDLDEALTFWTETAGYRWGPTVGGDTPVVTPDGEITVPMRIAYSADEPRLELVQAIPGTLWMPADSGVHHVGYWSDDVDADVARLLRRRARARGQGPRARRIDAVGVLQGRPGPRIELVSRAMQPLLQQLFVPAEG